MNRIKHGLVPTKKNNYHPFIVKGKGLIFTLLLIVLFNTVVVKLFPQVFLVASASDVNIYTLINLTNQERVNRGLNALNTDYQLINAATAKANYMLETDCWDHFCPGGSPWTFIKSSGYYYTVAGENLAKSFTTSEAIHSAWMSSTSHRENIINANFEDIGIAVVNGQLNGEETTLVVQMFGTREQQIVEATSPPEPQSIEYTPEQVTELPETAPKEPTAEISSPTDGEFLSDSIEILGKAENINDVYIFIDNNIIGQAKVNNNEFRFNTDQDLEEGNHILEIRAGDAISNEILDTKSFTTDTINPEILRNTLQFTSLGADSVSFSIKVEDNPIIVEYQYNKTAGTLSYNESADLWLGKLTVGEILPEDLLLFEAVDNAGNGDEVIITGNELSEMFRNFNITIENEVQPVNFMYTISSRFRMLNLKQIVNLVIAGMFILIFVVDWFVLVQTGKTHKRIKPFLNLPVFVGILVVGLLGTVGVVL